jgi:hypothetical protein
MNDGSTRAPGRDRQSGAVAVLIGILLIPLMSLASLAIDVGYLYAVRNELQNIADAAALAGARKLGNIYQGLSQEEQNNYDFTGDLDAIKDVAIEVADRNKAGNQQLLLAPADVVVGRWDQWKTLEPWSTKPPNLIMSDAVNVVTRKDNTSNGPVLTFFARVFGINTVSLRATATAALTGQFNDPGTLKLPVGISSHWFDVRECNDIIRFSPTNESCAGWTSFTYNANDANLRRILDGDPRLPTPSLEIGNEVNFIGGSLSQNTFDAFLLLFKREGYDVDLDGNPILDAAGNPLSDAGGQGIPLYDQSGARLYYPDASGNQLGTPRNVHKWSTSVLVYEGSDCSNPNQAKRIRGFANVEITDVLGAPEKIIEGKVVCDIVDPEPTRGGGGTFGVKGSIPTLVE